MTYSQAITQHVFERECVMWEWPEVTDLDLRSVLGGKNGLFILGSGDAVDQSGEACYLEFGPQDLCLYTDGPAPWRLLKWITRRLRRRGLTPTLDYADSNTAERHGTTCRWDREEKPE